MKCLPFILSATICFVCAHAQNKKIDSLNQELAKATTDTARINLMNGKAILFIQNNLDSTIFIAGAALEKAKQLHYSKGEADANRVTGIALTFKGNFKTALDHYITAEQLYRQLSDSNGLYETYKAYGTYYGMQSKYDSSVIFLNKLIDYHERNGNKLKLISAYQNIAVSYTMMSNYTLSLYYQNKALHLAESENDITDLAYINLNMGIGYFNIRDYARSENLLHKAIQYAQQAQIKNVELYGYSNLANIYLTLNKYSEAYNFAMKTVVLGRQLGDLAIVATALGTAGTTLAYQNRFAEAEQLSKQAIALADTAGSPLNIFQTLTRMGLIKKLQHQYAPAIQNYEKGFAALKDADIYDEQIGTSYNELAELYEQAGMYQKSLNAFKTSTKISDSIHSRENIRKATELSMNYDFAKKEQAIKAEQDKQNAIARARQLALMIGLGCTVLLIIGASIAYRSKQKANSLLLHQKDKLEKTLTELKATQAQLVQSEKMASLGELTAGIAHEIQNPLNFVNNFSEVSVELLDEMEAAIDNNHTQEGMLIAHEVKQNMQKIVHHGKRADSIVKSMLLHSRRSTGQKEPTNINTLADEYLRLSYHGLRGKDKTFNATLQTCFDNTIGNIRVVQQDVGRVLLNLFTNAFYATQQKQKRLAGSEYKPAVSVSTEKQDGTVEIRVRDNGDGIPEKIISKIFQPFFTTKPTGEGTGLGLSLSYDVITKGHGGTLTVQSEEGEYTEFIVTLPV